MKRIIVTFILLLLIVSVISAKPINVFFDDLSNPDDIQGQRFSGALRTLMYNSKEFVVFDKLDYGVFYLTIRSLDPDVTLTNEGHRTVYSVEFFYWTGSFLISIDSYLGISGKNRIQESAEQAKNKIVNYVTRFIKYHPDFFKEKKD